jgi:hypothetical protein
MEGESMKKCSAKWFLTKDKMETLNKDFNRFELKAITTAIYRTNRVQCDLTISERLKRQFLQETIDDAYRIKKYGFEVTRARLRVPP